MPFSFYDQFFLIDPAAPPGVGSLLDVNYFQVTDENDNGKIHKSGDDSIDGSDIIWVSNGDTITVVMGGVNGYDYRRDFLSGRWPDRLFANRWHSAVFGNI